MLLFFQVPAKAVDPERISSMSYKRILTVQDISCVGQCSLTVALPILSVCGLETAVLPSAVLSTHTTGFHGYTFRDLTEDMSAIGAHWKQEGIAFDAFYTGYLGNPLQIAQVTQIMHTLGKPGCVRIVDPAMADNGTLFPGFDAAYVQAMTELCREADILLPNLTEACLLTNTPYESHFSPETIQTLLDRLTALGAGTVVLTGVGESPQTSGVVLRDKGQTRRYTHRRIYRNCHGTGDVFASAFTGAYLRGKSVYDAARIAADFTLRCIERTTDEPSHWYGVKFEPVLPELLAMLGEAGA